MLLASALGLLAGCSHGPPLVARAGLTTVQQAELPAPTRADLTPPARTYVIGPFDRLSVEVYGVEDLRRDLEADASGRISFPIAGDIQALGMTPAELSTTIATRLRGYVRDPHVTVNMIETANNLVTVEGQVREPGLYPVVPGMTLSRAVASAKGLGEFAQIREVVVFRTAQGQHYAALYDLGAIQRGAYADPEIYANDIVVVGDSPSRRLIRDLLQAAPILVAPLIAVLQRN
jgi:polysaccharide export outer membrane protein